MPAIHRNPSRPCALNRCASGQRGRARGTIPNKYRRYGNTGRATGRIS